MANIPHHPPAAPRLLFPLAWFTLLASCCAGAAPLSPPWWVERGVVATASPVSTNDYAAATQGQVKWMADRAMAELSDKLPGGAGTAVSNLVASFSGAGANDYAGLNGGQLKTVAAPFYDRLRAAGWPCILPQGMTTNNLYPWATSSSPANDFAMVNLGQVKYAFSFIILSVDFLDASKNPVSTLKVGMWENAFNAGPTVKNDFIDIDPDRFHVRVSDQSKKGTGKVSVKLSTDSDGTAYDDDATEIELNEEPANSGIFISTNMLMVSDDVDDDFTNPNVVADETKNDRTHKIALGGKVKVQYPETGTVICEKEASVPPALKTVDVNVIILRDKAAATGGVPVIAVATVSDFWKIAKERYAQVGVDIQLSGPTVIDPPTGVDLADGLLARNPSSSTVLAAEAKSLIAGAGTTNTTDDIHVFYVNDVMAGSAPVGGTAVADFYYDESEDPYTYNVFISDSTSSSWGGYAAIHELTHLTTDAGHPTVDTWRLMHGALLTTSGATGSRRLTASEETAIRGNSHVH